MISNYECTNFDCDYSTNRTDNLKIKELNRVVLYDGGYIKDGTSCCPKCFKNSLVYVSTYEGEKSPKETLRDSLLLTVDELSKLPNEELLNKYELALSNNIKGDSIVDNLRWEIENRLKYLTNERVSEREHGIQN